MFLRRFLERARRRRLRLLHHGSVRSAVEGALRRRGRRVLGHVRRAIASRSSRSSNRSCAFRSGRRSRRSRSRSPRCCSRCFTCTAARSARAAAACWRSSSTRRPTLPSGSSTTTRSSTSRRAACSSAALLMLGMLGVIAVLIAEAHEWAEARWGDRRTAAVRRRALPARALPKVSIHVPAYNEPPEMLIETLDALARLDYPDFEVIVIDNNTDGRGGVAAGRAALRAARRALPLLPRRAAARASRPARSTSRSSTPRRMPQIVAVIDSDYKVEPALAARPRARRSPSRRSAIVQAPQDYRDARRERVQGDVLRRVPRLLPHRHGHAQRAQRDHPARHDDAGAARGARARRRLGASGASPRMPNSACACSSTATKRSTCRDSYGRGLMPETFTRLQETALPLGLRRGADPARARARAVLAARDERLTRGQRYHFVAGWLPWLADGLNLLFNDRCARLVARDGRRSRTASIRR